MRSLPQSPALPAPSHLGGDADHAAPVGDGVTQLFLAHRREICRYLTRRGCLPTEAEELAQDVFLRFYRARMGGLQIEAPRQWLFRVARNLAIDHLRRTRDLRRLTESTPGDAADRVADTAPSLEDQMLNRSRQAALSLATAELTELQRECLDLRAEGLTLREISAVVNVSVSGASDAIRRAIRRLQRALDGHA